ncbi:MAG: anaerobic carbon-monoxide dehydrogenase catalytic subunit [candidate division WOR-3 bacterium]|nr:anaerobic carbon-monoxide dehydrogenase catalytic subunit [Candidatus Omnitrophota bacterium]MCM8807451.1 anaerobic carbon-monoxide dehydrogenase catalytic subunit [Candidatus Omnitrophota bacterium]
MSEKKFTTAEERLKSQEPQCGFGIFEICCRNCSMGPCRISPFDDGPKKGVCGADEDVIVARNFLRKIAVGASAHSDHGRAVAETLIKVARKEAIGYEIKDEFKLIKLALEFGIDVKDKKIEEIALKVGEICLSQFGQQEGNLIFTKRAPVKRQRIWSDLEITPRGIDREVVESLHRTHMGTDQDFYNLMKQAQRCALSDGWGGSMVATDLQDVLFGTPEPILGRVNFGVLKDDYVNIIVHGHEPLLSEMIVVASEDPELINLAKQKGAKGINIGGICCTANEILMRHGIPIIGNFLNQEMAITTGAVEVMVVDVQCIMASLPEIASCFHTKIITTSEKTKIPGAIHVKFTEENALEKAKEIIKMAIENFENRKKENVIIPESQIDLVAGFSYESIYYILGGRFRASYRPLNDNIINGKIRGIAGVVGCNNPKVSHDEIHIKLVSKLIENDVLVLQTGCSAIACAKAGFLDSVKGLNYAGKGLREVCEAVGIPPVIHMGSCVDNSRILMAATCVVKEGGLGDDISELPAAGAAPEWMSEKALSIGQYFVSSGIFVVFGVTWPTLGSKNLTKYLFEDIEKEVGGKWAFESDPDKMAELILKHIDEKRRKLGIDKARERILYDMAMRRELE